MIYDAIHFFNETEILALRLEHMLGMVDKHIVFESSKTYSGHDKGFLLDLNHPRIKPFQDRIIYIQSTSDIPIPQGILQNWRREFYQRDILRVSFLPLCKPDDLVFVCDVDQIPRQSTWDAAKSMAQYHGVACVEMTNHGYFMNRIFKPMILDHTIQTSMINNARLVTAAFAANPPPANPNMDAELVRSVSYRVSYFHDPKFDVKDAGWHLSSMGGPRSVLFKLDSFSHENEEFTKKHGELVKDDFMALVDQYTIPYPIEQLPQVVQDRESLLRMDGFIL